MFFKTVIRTYPQLAPPPTWRKEQTTVLVRICAKMASTTEASFKLNTPSVTITRPREKKIWKIHPITTNRYHYILNAATWHNIFVRGLTSLRSPCCKKLTPIVHYCIFPTLNRNHYHYCNRPLVDIVLVVSCDSSVNIF